MVKMIKRKVFFTYLILPYIFYLQSPFQRLNLEGEDAYYYLLPAKEFIVKSILHGEMPFWNPYVLCGTPFLADIEMGIFYPLNWIYLIMDSGTALNINLLLHLTFIGFFTFLYLRQLGCSNFASFFGGTAFMFSGFMVGHRVHVNLIQAAAWMPLIMLIIERIIEDNRIKLKDILYGCLILSLQIFAGSPQISFYTLIFVICRLSFVWGQSRHNIKALSISAAAIFFISLGITSIQLLPTYFFQLHTIRSHMSYGFFTEHSFYPLFFIVMIFPYFFGYNMSTPLYYYYKFWGKKIDMLSINEYSSYQGIILYIGLALAIAYCLRNKHVKFYLFMSILAIFMMFGKNNPFFSIIYKIPLLNLFRSPVRYNFLLNFSLSIVAAHGIDYLTLSFNEIKRKNIRFMIVIFLFVICFTFFVVLFLNRTIFEWFLKGMTINPESLASTLKYTQGLTLSNLSVNIPLSLMIVSFVVFFSPVLIKRFDIFGMTLWKAAIMILLFFDLFIFGYFINNKVDTTKISYKMISPIMQNITHNKDYRYCLEHSIEFNDCQLAEFQSPNLNMYHGNRFAFADSYGLFSDEIRRLFVLESYGAKKDLTDLLINNKILSAYAIKYIFLNNLNPLGLKVVNYINDNNHNMVQDTQTILLDDISLMSMNDSWAQKTVTHLNLEGKTIYEISFDMRGENTQTLFISVYSPKLKRNLILQNINVITDDWQFFNKMFISDIPLPECELHIYSKSTTPIYLNNITIKRLPYVPANNLNNNKIMYLLDRKNWDQGLFLYKNKNALPIVYCVRKVKKVGSLNDFYKIASISPTTWRPETTAIIESNNLPNWDLENNPMEADLSVSVKAPKPLSTPARHLDVQYIPEIVAQGVNFIEIKSDSNAGQLLVFADTYLPGWKAWIDKVETNIYKTNGVLKGVYVPKGLHIIRFQYKAPGFDLGLYIALGTIILVSLAVLVYKSIKTKI